MFPLSSFWALLAIRVANSALLQTSFNPDEYWQSLEVAHKLAFGYGHCTWEWVTGIRGVIHPALFVPLFAGLHWLGWDTTTSLIVSAKLVQSVAAAATDQYVYRLADKLYGRPAARWALACQLLAWFNAFCLPRTFSNCLEALCTVAAVYYWPHLLDPRPPSATPIPTFGPSSPPASPRNTRPTPAPAHMGARHHRVPGTRLGGARHWSSRPLALAIAAVGVLLRPSSALFWALVGLYELLVAHDRAAFVFRECVPLGAAALGAGMLLDRTYYGRWVVVPWEFFKFNILQGGSALYGAHPWHWNFTQGLPTIVGPLLPLVLYGCSLSSPASRRLGLLAGAVLVLYSLPAHKEFRILLPALHLLMPPCGAAIQRIRDRCSDPNSKKEPANGAARASDPRGAASGQSVPGRQEATQQQSRQSAGSRAGRQDKGGGGLWWWGVLLLLLINIPMAAYFCLVHQRGGLAAMRHLEAAATKLPDDGMAVLFLMPCHSTPLYSHLHRRIPLHFLDCSPPGYAASVAAANGAVARAGDGWAPAGYSSETDFFMRQPLEYVEARFAGAAGLPYSHVVMYEGQAGILASWMHGRGCRQDARLFNAHMSNGHDLQRAVWIWSCPLQTLSESARLLT